MSDKRQKWLLPYLIYLGTIPMLTIDMYLPSLPTLVETFDSTLGQVNLTLVIFLLVFSGSLLVWGTLSDKFGRKPVLIATLALFSSTSFLCATASTLYQLIAFRSIQAIGAGATIAISMAIMKDAFEGEQRGKALAISNMFQIIAPITAPSIGAVILTVFSWRGVFITLGIAGAIAFGVSLLLTETAPAQKDQSLLKTISNLVGVLKIPGFSFPLPILGLAGCPIFLFLGASADIYITHYGLNEQLFGVMFGVNAFFSFIGSSLYFYLSKKVGTNSIIYSSFFFILLAGILVLVFGMNGPFIFAATLVPATISAAMMRPPGSNLLLEQVDENAGAASSMMTFIYALSGSLGIQFISLDWTNRVTVIGISFIVCALISLLFWPLAYRKCKPV